MHHHFAWRNAKSFCCFSLWERLGYAFNTSWRVSSMKRLRTNCLCLYTLLHACTKRLCTWSCSLTENVSECRLSTWLKCLASGKKSIEQLRPSVPRQTSALELLVVYCFRILLVYPCALYCGMLILSRAHGACPIPPGYQHSCGACTYVLSS